MRWGRDPFLAVEPREGQAHTAEDALGFVVPVLLRAKAYAERVWLRIDAGRGSPLAARTRPPRRKLAAQSSFSLDHFFLLTNVPATEMAAEALLQHYRARDAAEKDFGEWQHSPDLSLSSTPRPKSHYRG